MRQCIPRMFPIVQVSTKDDMDTISNNLLLGRSATAPSSSHRVVPHHNSSSYSPSYTQTHYGYASPSVASQSHSSRSAYPATQQSWTHNSASLPSEQRTNGQQTVEGNSMASSSATSSTWTWSPQYNDYYMLRNDANGKYNVTRMLRS
jgi:hypothetical protein